MTRKSVKTKSAPIGKASSRGPKQTYNHDPKVSPSAGQRPISPKRGPSVITEGDTYLKINPGR